MATSGGIQQRGSVAGSLIIALFSTAATADDPTTVTCDGTPVTVDCDIAAPPDWMDAASNIIAAGLYQVQTRVTAGDAATVPGLLALVASAGAAEQINIDVLALGDAQVESAVIPLSSGDVPFPVAVTVTPPTDITATFDAIITVTQIATVTS